MHARADRLVIARARAENAPLVRAACFGACLRRATFAAALLVWLVACTTGSTTTTTSTTTSTSSTAPPPPLVPDVLGSTAQQAKASINTLGFKPKADSDWSRGEKGTVIDQKPAPGTEAAEGTTVVYVVSEGNPTVPQWVHTSFGLPSATKLVKAKQLLTQRKLGLAIVYRTHPVFSLYDLGEVFASTPKPGAKVRTGTQVTLVVAEPLACTPGYSVCFPPITWVGGSLKDYDCPGGDGPNYASYTRVYGDDPYELDDDSDGVGCE